MSGLVLVLLHGLIGCIAAILSINYAMQKDTLLERVRSMQIGVVVDVVLVVPISIYFTMPLLMLTFIAKYLFLTIVDFKKTFEVK